MPLSYPSSRCVLEHMEANQRYFLAARCPSLRALHKSVPLSIQSIKMCRTSVMVNGVDHSFHSMAAPEFERQERTLPLHLRQVNSVGGCPFDLNRFGNKDYRIYVEGTEHERLDDAELDRIFMGEGERSVYDIYITYSTENAVGPRRSVRYPIGMKIKDAFNVFLQNFMGGRRIPNVSLLEVKPEINTKLPSRLKFNVQEVRAMDNLSTDYFPSVEKFLDPVCLPLKKLSVDYWESATFSASRHPILHTSLYLEIQRYHGSLLLPPDDLVDIFAEAELGEFPQSLLPWNNKIVHVCDKTVRMEELMKFVQYWSKQHRDLGTKFSFQRNGVTDCVEIIRSVGGTQATIPSRLCPEVPYAITFRIRAGLELNVYGAEVPNSLADGESWMLVMEYMKEGSAVPVNN